MNGKTDLFKDFFKSEKAGGFVLICCSLLSIILAYSQAGTAFLNFWHSNLNLSFARLELNYSIEHWINDGLMTIFFLLVGLEIERELYIGELATIKKALLPILCAIGGMIFPAGIYLLFNSETSTVSGFGIPMATDIAFALGILSLAGKSIPISLKVFLTALAIIDDLGAILVIAVFYSKSIELVYLGISLLVFMVLFVGGKKRIFGLTVYLVGGLIMWYCMLRSGIHPSIAGVLLAFAIPFQKNVTNNLSFKIQKALHFPVAFIVLPLFALANAAIIIPSNWVDSFTQPSSIGIMAGLIIGKTAGILLVAFFAIKFRLSSLPADMNWRHLRGIAILGGIGFTMSIFIANLAFEDPQIVVSSKLSILVGSLLSAVGGLVLLRFANSASKHRS